MRAADVAALIESLALGEQIIAEGDTAVVSAVVSTDERTELVGWRPLTILNTATWA